MIEIGKLSGNTPLIKITDKLYAKLETYNPSGSVKDRMISYVVNDAKLSGHIKNDSILCDATSGNTGIALSMMAASLGLRCVIFMPVNMSEERKKMMSVYGAEIIYSPEDDFEAAIEMRDDFISKNKKAWSPMQFSNPKNIECHQLITAPEIIGQLNSLGLTWGAFIHGSGTGGTIEGVRRSLIEKDLSTKVCLVKPDKSPHGIQGISDGKDFLAKESDMDYVLEVSTERAIDRAKTFARSTGLLVGISSGANLAASEQWLNDNDIDGVAVTILCDRGERYMSIY